MLEKHAHRGRTSCNEWVCDAPKESSNDNQPDAHSPRISGDWCRHGPRNQTWGHNSFETSFVFRV